MTMQAPPLRIFLIDEYRLVRDGLKLHLQAAPGLEVVGEAADVRHAMAQLASTAADVVVTDIGRGELGDVGVDDVVGCLGPAAVLVLSWRAQPAMVARAMRAGAKGYLLKRASPDRVVQAIRVVAAGGTFLGADTASVLFDDAAPDRELSRRELEVLYLVAQAKPSKVIAQHLGISPRTIESHRQSIKRKLQLNGHASLIKYAIEHMHNGAPHSPGRRLLGGDKPLTRY